MTRTRIIVGILLLSTAILFSPELSTAQTSASAALTGRVSSQEEGPMEGVLVSAGKAGSTIRVTVASDQQGRYRFPRNRLEPGEYALTIRAVGYEVDPTQVTITPQKPAMADLRLRKTQDLSGQLTNAEWLLSMPGGDRKNFLLNCTTCHTLQRIVYSKHDATEFTKVLQRMAGNSPGSWPTSSPLFPQNINAPRDLDRNPERFRKQAEFLSTINLSSVPKWEYPLKTLPRPKGKSTHMVITEYQLPRQDAHPHDVIRGSDGMAWYMDFEAPYFGKLDPQTGHVTEYPVPLVKPERRGGGLEVQEDKDGNIWIGLRSQSAVAKFDKKSSQFQMFPIPNDLNPRGTAQVAMVEPTSSHVDGKVWMRLPGSEYQLMRVDVTTGKFDAVKPLADGHGSYGISPDSRNNLYFMDLESEYIGRVDSKTLDVKYYRTPTRTSLPRRGHLDTQDRLWFAEYFGNQVGMFDPRTEQFQEWAIPTPWTNPYDAVADKNGEVWTGGMSSDRIIRINSKTGETTEYLLPEETNVRRVFVDNATTPVTFWVGNNNRASIIKLEPLE